MEEAGAAEPWGGVDERDFHTEIGRQKSRRIAAWSGAENYDLSLHGVILHAPTRGTTAGWIDQGCNGLEGFSFVRTEPSDPSNPWSILLFFVGRRDKTAPVEGRPRGFLDPTGVRQ